MKTSVKLAVFLTSLMMVGSTRALTITYLPPVRSGNISSVGDLNTALGITTGAEMWYKSDNGGTHDSDFTSSISGDEDTGWAITLHYVGGTPLPNITYGAVKAADEFILYSISGWNGEDIKLDQDQISHSTGGPSPQTKYNSISHAVLFATAATNTPDGGVTAALLGLGCIGLAASRKLSV